jgi:glycerol-3-phosphate dehydrogenase
VGGKWTTFRALSEHLANDTLAALGAARKKSTADLAIGGGKGFPAGEQAEKQWIAAAVRPGYNEERVGVLLTRYGTRATDVLEFLAQGEDSVFSSTRELSTREVEYMVRNEQVGHLIDILIRRTSLAFRGLVTAELLAELAAVLAPLLGWDKEAAAAEIRHAEAVLADAHRVEVRSLIA